MIPPSFTFSLFVLVSVSIRGFPQMFGDLGFVLIFKIMVLKYLKFSVHTGGLHKRLCRESYAYLNRPIHGELLMSVVLFIVDRAHMEESTHFLPR